MPIMEDVRGVEGECGYCGQTVKASEQKEHKAWLPLECVSCSKLFHLHCLKVGTGLPRPGSGSSRDVWLAS